MSENILKCLKLIVKMKLIFMDNNAILYDSLRYSFAEIYLCELNILLAFHYLIFKSQHDFTIKLRQ